MNNNTSSRTGVWVAVIVVIIIIILGLWAWNKSVSNQPVATTATTTTDMTSTSTDTTTVAAGDVQYSLENGDAAPMYSAALKTYLNKRIQFSMPAGQVNACVASPTSLTFASGVKFMLDNRMNIPATIHLTNSSYTLPAYTYEIISLSSPATYKIDCNASQNVVTLQIQK